MNGIINVIKPPTMSSNGVTVYLRKLLNEKKIGHAGTLDPQAAGVLVCLLGRSTRLSDHLMAERKRYIAEVTFGIETDTLDTEGTVIGRDDKIIGRDELEKAIRAFTGEIEQTPPGYSAIKVGGRKAYELAREGKTVELKKRRVHIYFLDILACTGEKRYLLDITCEKGTYIRTLLSDIGSHLNTVAVTSFLLRAASGSFDVEHGYTLDEIRDMKERGDMSFLLNPGDVLSEYPMACVDEREGMRMKNGMEIPSSEGPEGSVRIYAGDEFLGIGTRENGRMKLRVPLY